MHFLKIQAKIFSNLTNNQSQNYKSVNEIQAACVCAMWVAPSGNANCSASVCVSDSISVYIKWIANVTWTSIKTSVEQFFKSKIMALLFEMIFFSYQEHDTWYFVQIYQTDHLTLIRLVYECVYLVVWFHSLISVTTGPCSGHLVPI